MITPFADILPALAPAFYLFGAIASRLAPRAWTSRIAVGAAGGAFAAAIGAGALLIFRAAAPVETAAGAIYLDALSATILGLIGFVGLLAIHFSQNYLGGNSRLPTFNGWMCATLACVATLVIAGDLRILVAAWIATSLALHQLLLFYRERPLAIVAARKKFISARIGDIALIGAALILAAGFDTTNIGDILTRAQASAANDPRLGLLSLAPFLLAIAAALKSAQFPTHGWLAEVMETPTPVSALLHAGIVNAGGFLLIRFADVMLLNSSAMHVLALIGGFSALFGSIVMLTQTSVKVSLAYSTVAQMGFMLLQCGLGAFASATLHIVAHSLYKAHAFLSSGRAVHLARIPRPALSARKSDAAIALAASSAIFLVASALFGGVAGESPALVALGLIFIFGLAMFLSALLATPAGRVSGIVLAACAALSYFALQNGVAAFLGDAVPAPQPPDATGWAVIALAGLSFAALAFAQISQIRMVTALERQFYVHASNGLYANAIFNRLIDALRVRAQA